jgi:hypothetical protein
MIPLGILGNRRGGGAAGSYELISTTLLSTSTASVSFSSIVGTYKHLQLRVTGRSTTTSGGFYSTIIKTIVNSDTGSNYAWHYLSGSGTSVQSGGSTSQSSLLYTGSIPTSEVTADIFGAAIIDILDYASTSKNKTFRTLSGHHSSNAKPIQFSSGLWMNTSAITNLTLSSNLGNFAAGSRFSLYGIKG